MIKEVIPIKTKALPIFSDPLKDESEIKVQSFNSDDLQQSHENFQLEADDTVMKIETTTHKCETCGESFSRAMYLKKHMNTIHKTHFDNKCEFCGKWFQDSKNLRIHIYKFHKEKMKKDIKCGSCEKTFYTKQQLQSHGYNIHSENYGKSKCDVCGRMFSDSRNLKKHQRRVSFFTT